MIADREAELNIIQNGNLANIKPSWLMVHGPTKLYVDKYIWHSPDKGIVASYSPTERDVEDHFGLFRGVDQIEAFAQASTGSCGAFLECRKQNCTPDELKKKYIPSFTSIGQVIFHNYLELGDTFISIGNIAFYKWRQTICHGRVYKVPKGLDLSDYFSDFNDERLLNYDINKNFTLAAELFDITGRAMTMDFFKKNE